MKDATEHKRGGERFVKIVAFAVCILFVLPGLWAFVAPQSFFSAVATFEPYNAHFIRDLGAFQVGFGAVLLLAVVVRDALLASLVAVGVGAVLHLLAHFIDHDLGGNPEVDIPVFALMAVLLVAAAIVRAVALREDGLILGPDLVAPPLSDLGDEAFGIEGLTAVVLCHGGDTPCGSGQWAPGCGLPNNICLPHGVVKPVQF
jgi:uncharacterized protein YjeT (DUF2065 family)